MFSSLLAAPCELKLHLLQNAIFLRPPTSQPNEDSPPTANDEVARGLVELYVPNDRKIGGIRVKLRAVQSVAILPDHPDQMSYLGATPIGWEDTVLMEKVVEIGLPKRKSHATIPGDDVINSSERRGRSRVTRSGSVTPSASRATSPDPNAPPQYEEQESSRAASISAAFARTTSSTSRGSHSQSRSGSQSNSRSVSRNASPNRAGNSGTSTAHASPRRDSIRLEPSPTTSSSNLTRLPSATSIRRDTPTEEYDMPTLSQHLSRTGLSNGRSEASGSHLHTADRHDFYGVNPPESGSTPRGRGGVGSDLSSIAASRSATMSPSGALRGRQRPESRSRILGLGRKGNRAPSADAAASLARSTSNSTDEEGGGLELQKGVHGFEFAFIIPADSPPFERSPYGRVRYLIKATAIGAGRAKSNLEAWRDLFPVVNPSPEGGPTPLTILYNDVHATVGLISIACTSNNISVGGIFNVDIYSPTPPTDLIVYLVRVSVETSIELRTRKRGKQMVPTQRNKIFEKGYVPPRAKDPHGQGDGKKSEGIIRDPSRSGSRNDDAWTVQGVARMPNDNVVRASTLPRSKASIRFSHTLLIEVVHSRDAHLPEEDRKLKVFALRQPITLPSCCVAYDAVSLPAYSRDYDGERPAAMPYDLASQGRQQHNNGGIRQASTVREPTGSSNSNNNDNVIIPGRGRGGAGSSRTRSVSRSRWINTSYATPLANHEFCVCGQSIQDLSERERDLLPAIPHAELPLDGLSYRKIGELPEELTGRGNSKLRRSSSRSSSGSGRGGSSTDKSRSVSIGRSISRIRNSESSSSSKRAPSVQRNGLRRSLGERGEGVIRTMSRGSRASELPGEAQGHHINGITNPPAYGEEPMGTSNGGRSLDAVAEDDRRGRMPRREGDESM